MVSKKNDLNKELASIKASLTKRISEQNKEMGLMYEYEHIIDLYLDGYIDIDIMKNFLKVKLINDSQEVVNKISLKKLDMEGASRLFEKVLTILSESFESYKKIDLVKFHYIT